MVNFDMKFMDALEFSDVFILPSYSEIATRQSVDTKVLFGKKGCMDVPIISANMDTISGADTVIAMYKSRAFGALHRFSSIEENVNEYKKVQKDHSECFVSVGVNRDSKERTSALYSAGARYFILDIAHSDSLLAKDMTHWIKENYNDVFLVVGNVATPNAVKRLEMWGADAVKVGIGPGAVCLTKNVTGVTCPQFTAIARCAEEANVPIIADGGIREIGDIAKAIGAGASMVMAGGIFSGCLECPGEIVEIDGNKHKTYRGMASSPAMQQIRKEGQLPTPEGKVTTVPLKGSVKQIVEDIAGGLRSAFSYIGAKNMKEFQENVKFGTRKNR